MSVLVLLALASGCVLAFKRPTVRVAEVRLASMTFSGGTVAVTLSIANPNRFALESRDFNYRLAFFDGTPEEAASQGGTADRWIHLSGGRVEEPVKIPAHGTGSVTVELPFDLGTVGRAAGRLLRQGELEYRFTGELLFHTPVGGKRLPFDERGRFRP